MLSHEHSVLSCQQAQPQPAACRARNSACKDQDSNTKIHDPQFYPNDLLTELDGFAPFFFFPSICFSVHENNYEVIETEGKKAPNLLGSCHVIVDL